MFGCEIEGRRERFGTERVKNEKVFEARMQYNFPGKPASTGGGHQDA
jgi:hypothetical protein